MIHGDVFRFHESLQDKKVVSFYYSLSGSERDDLLRMLLEFNSPVQAIDEKIHKMRLKRSELSNVHPDVDRYIEDAEKKLDNMALQWFKINNMIDSNPPG